MAAKKAFFYVDKGNVHVEHFSHRNTELKPKLLRILISLNWQAKNRFFYIYVNAGMDPSAGMYLNSEYSLF